MDYNKKINFYFKRTGLTQEELGEKLGYSQVMTSRYLSSENPSIKFLLAFNKHYEIDFNFLLKESHLKNSEVNEQSLVYQKTPDVLLNEIENRVDQLKKWHNSATK